MALPDVTVVVRDGALGIVPPNTSGQAAAIGVSTAGTGNTPILISDAATLVAIFGAGPLVEAAAHMLAVGGGPLVCMRITAAGVGAASVVAKAGTGGSVGTVTGTPTDDNDPIVRIATGALLPTNGLGAYQLSLDNGKTYGAVTSVPTTGAIVVGTTGTTLTLSAATLVAGDTYGWHDTAPAFTNAELATAMDALIADTNVWFMVHVVGVPADAAATAAMFATLDSKLQGAATTYARWAFGMLQSADIADSALITMGTALASTRVALGAGFVSLTSAITGNQYKRPVVWSAAARATAVQANEDIGRFASGNILGVTGLFRDEYKTQGLDVQRFITARSFYGQPGFYLTRGVLFAPNGSDYQFIANRRVVDIGSAVGRINLLQVVNETVRVNRTTGYILEKDARNIENSLESAERAALTQPGLVSDITVTVDRTTSILTTGQVKATLRILPTAYARYITFDIGLTNPALQAQ